MDILIAGANGMIGSFLYNRLYNDYSITAMDYGQGLIEKNYFSLDLSQEQEVETFAEKSPKCYVLIFLVGLAHAKGMGKDLPEFKKINYQTLVNLLSTLDSNNKIPEKIIFASTISVYGERYKQSFYNETLDPYSFSPYAVTKLQAEQYLQENFENRSWILRFAPVYSSDFLLNVDRRTKIGGRFYRVGNGFKKLSLCNIENIIAAVDAIINGDVPAGVYNLSDPIEYSYNELLTWRNAERVIRIPLFAVGILYHLGKLFNSTFLKENTVKLISNNVFPSDKIRSYVDLPAGIRVQKTKVRDRESDVSNRW